MNGEAMAGNMENESNRNGDGTYVKDGRVMIMFREAPSFVRESKKVVLHGCEYIFLGGTTVGLMFGD
jgi:hypothetical protein